MTDQDPQQVQQRLHIADLIGRYPAIAASEIQETLRFLRRGPILQVGLLRGDPDLQPSIARIEEDHPVPATNAVKRLIIFGMLVVVPFILFCWFAWDSGAK